MGELECSNFFKYFTFSWLFLKNTTKKCLLDRREANEADKEWEVLQDLEVRYLQYCADDGTSGIRLTGAAAYVGGSVCSSDESPRKIHQVICWSHSYWELKKFKLIN